MKRLVINADDFGLCRAVNAGILKAYREGVVTSATLMVNMPGAAEALAMAAAHPGLGVGVHITLTAGRPLSGPVEGLTGSDGRFLKLHQWREGARSDLIRREVEMQVGAFRSAGLAPTHLDSHHHVHRDHPAVAAALEAVAGRLSIPVRQFGPGFSDQFYGRERVSAAALLSLVERLPDGFGEIMCHPGCVDPELRQLTSYAEERALELATLTDPGLRRALSAAGVRLVSYRDLSEQAAPASDRRGGGPWAKG